MRNWPQPLDLLVVASFVAVTPLPPCFSPSLLCTVRGCSGVKLLEIQFEENLKMPTATATRTGYSGGPQPFGHKSKVTSSASSLPPLPPSSARLSASFSPLPAHLGLPSRLEPHVYPWNLIGCTAHRAKATTAAAGEGGWRVRWGGGCVWKCLCWVKVAFGTCCTCKLALIYQHNGATWRLN